MRIAVVTDSFDPTRGGVENAVWNLVGEWRDSGHEVLSITWRESNGHDAGEETCHGAPIHRFAPPVLSRRPWRWPAFLRSAPGAIGRTAQLLRRHRVDVVNVHYPTARLMLVEWLRRFHPFRLIVHFHGSDLGVFERARKNRARRIIEGGVRRADMVVANSHSALQRLRATGAELPATQHVIGNGVPRCLFEVERQEAPPPSVFAFGRIVPKKGFDVLIHAFERVRRAHPAARLTLGGRGSERDACERLVEELGLGRHVSFLGHLSRGEVAHHLAECAVVAIPSRDESFGIVLLEAMAAGCPTVASGVGGMVEIVGESGAALLVPPDDSSALADAIVSLLDSPERRLNLSDTARRRAMAPEFDWHEIARQYAEIMGGPR